MFVFPYWLCEIDARERGFFDDGCYFFSGLLAIVVISLEQPHRDVVAVLFQLQIVGDGSVA